MRKRLLILAAGVVLLALAGAVTAYFLANRPPTPGGLETAPTDIEVVTPTVPQPKPKPIKRPPPAENVDNRCWKMFGGGPTRSLARPLIHLGIPVKPPLWARGLQSYVEYPPSYCDGVLYVNTFRGDTWAIKAKTGKVIWRRRSTAQKPSTPAISGALLIVSAKDGTVSALNRRNGRLVWQLRTHAKVESSPAIVKGVAYFGATDGRLFSVWAETGKIRWVYNTGGRINSSPSLANGRVCITTYAGSILCLRAKDGKRLWVTYVKRDRFRYESFYASASTDGRRLYTIGRSGTIVTLDARNGRIEWKRSLSSWGYSTPAVGDDRVFIGGFDGALHAYRKTDGKELWRAHVGGRILGGPLIVGNLVFFSTLEQKTFAARTDTGQVVWRYPIGKYSPGIATERAYYFTLNGILVALRGQYSPR